ncbi:MAG: membrane fusion protein (multidrug efflux system) [Bacteroidia bacterium]|jgi:membrane fusion protein (multidrug efflux system)
MPKSVHIRRSIVIALLVIAVSVLIFYFISQKEVKVENTSSFRKMNVQTQFAKNEDKKLLIDLSGKLVAKNRIDIYAEVTGVLRSNNFREGQIFAKGQVLAQVDDGEIQANVKSQKGILLNSIAQILPDMAIDYPMEVVKWKLFHAAIDFNKSLPPMPEIESDKLKMFVSSKNVFTNYFSIKSLELRLAKHKITAPFLGVLSTTDIDPGTLVRVGQRIGTFIQPNTYELEGSISVDDLKFVNKGSVVRLTNEQNGAEWQGKILRINEQIDPATQSIKVYIGINDPMLKEGQYLSAIIQGTNLLKVVEAPRNLLLDKDEMFFIEDDSVLSRKKVNVVYRGVESVYLKDIPDGAEYLSQTVSSAHDGMIVTILSIEE